MHQKHSLRHWATAVMLAMTALAGCSSSNSGGDGPPQPDGGTGGVGGMTGLCKDACERVKQAGCSQEHTCFCAQETAPTEACAQQAKAKWECVLTNATIECENGDSKLAAGCDDELLALSQCVLCQPDPSAGPCPSCELQNCCKQYAELIGVPSYANLKETCLDQCADADCREACYQSDPDVAAAYQAAKSCQQTKCAGVC